MNSNYLDIIVSQEKCKHFKNPKVREAFEVICADEMLSNKHFPNYDLIIDILDNAISDVRKNSESVQFYWLTEAVDPSKFKYFFLANLNKKTIQ